VKITTIAENDSHSPLGRCAHTYIPERRSMLDTTSQMLQHKEAYKWYPMPRPPPPPKSTSYPGYPIQPMQVYDSHNNHKPAETS